MDSSKSIHKFADSQFDGLFAYGNGRESANLWMDPEESMPKYFQTLGADRKLSSRMTAAWA